MIFIMEKCKTEPELSRETIIAIKKARERMKKGKFLKEAEAKKRLTNKNKLTETDINPFSKKIKSLATKRFLESK